jgi:hypothetical protein
LGVNRVWVYLRYKKHLTIRLLRGPRKAAYKEQHDEEGYNTRIEQTHDKETSNNHKNWAARRPIRVPKEVTRTP